jgi:hypothetical protein
MSALIERSKAAHDRRCTRLQATLDGCRVTIRKQRSASRRLGDGTYLTFERVVPGWLALQSYPPAYLLADVRTATVSWKRSNSQTTRS